MAQVRFSEIERDLIDQGGILAKRWGYGEPLGRVFVAIQVAEEPLTQKDIAEKTEYSLSLVSPTLKSLEKLGMIRRKRARSKERHYEPQVSFVEWTSMMISHYLDQDVRPLIERVEQVPKQELQKRKGLTGVIREYKVMEFILTNLKKMLVVKRTTQEKVRKLLD